MSAAGSDAGDDAGGELITEDALIEAFKIFDKDGDGALSRDELSRALGCDLSDEELDMIIKGTRSEAETLPP